MIRNDHPFSVYFPEDKGIMSAKVTNRSFKHPFAHYKVMVAADLFHLNDIKIEFAHTGSIGIGSFIIGESIIESIGYSRFADEHKGIIFPVTAHKIFEVAGVPVFSLFLKNFPDLGFVRLRKEGCSQEYGKKQ